MHIFHFQKDFIDPTILQKLSSPPTTSEMIELAMEISLATIGNFFALSSFRSGSSEFYGNTHDYSIKNQERSVTFTRLANCRIASAIGNLHKDEVTFRKLR